MALRGGNQDHIHVHETAGDCVCLSLIPAVNDSHDDSRQQTADDQTKNLHLYKGTYEQFLTRTKLEYMTLHTSIIIIITISDSFNESTIQ